MEEEVNTYQQFNFEIALEKIEVLTEQNNELLDTIDRLEEQLKNNSVEINHSLRIPTKNRFTEISRGADAAMERFTAKLRKELNKNGKSKQSKRQPI